MAIPFIGNRAAARTMIGLGVGWGFSPTRMMRYLIDEKGLFYARRYMEADIREIYGRHWAAGRAKFLPLDVAPSKRIMAEIPMLVDRKYSYRFEFTQRDREGNVILREYRHLTTDQVLSRREAETMMRERFAGRENYEDDSVPLNRMLSEGDFNLEAVFHHEGYGY
jgi:hypothetical protein